VRGTSRVALVALLGLALALVLGARWAFAFDQGESTPLPTQIEIPPQPAEPRSSATPNLDEPPPPRPTRHGLVLETTLGALAFAGQFRHVAPPAYLMRAALGYDLLKWLTVLGTSELAFTDTSESEDPSLVRAFPIWGFGGGIRAGARMSSRLAAFIEGDVGAMAADVPHNTLANLGFRSAESLGVAAGGRVGVEWYQVDSHFAISFQGGSRAAMGFSHAPASGDLPLMWDIDAGLKYAF
jgi:hypothetical protein